MATDKKVIETLAEELISLFREYWVREEDHHIKQKLKRAIAGLNARILTRISDIGFKGWYTITNPVTHEPILFIESGELFFIDSNLARECKKRLGGTYQLLQIVE
jgi:hypothetical protein